MKNRRIHILTVFNKDAAGTSPAAEMEQLQKDLQEHEGDPQSARLRKAEVIARLATAEWQEVWDANKRMPGITDASELDRLRLNAEIARQHLAEIFAANVRSTLSQVRSQLNQLDEEVHRLRDRVEMLSMRN